ncbi:tetratricopeptide repeat protein [Patiriisocius hiemis]|uniref:Tetratricopeptide repeat protein n=1 Tax=Patiriisocius hiemis TaxID=3075604 RepID=A0ABU2YBY4_9FLAO|nr:tetratricopeptide repeat protein [Constantimarinum sp. W242]MDT0555698.1 tetratricopeptide repeat protein [Constantimarinum sp. W242]
MKWYITLIILLFVSISVGQNDALFNKGISFYKEKKYTEAIDAWKQIEQHGSHSASLYFNLGNAYYKLNSIGPSVYYYEKALQLAPNDSDIKNNLAFAENARIDAIEPLPQSVFSKWYNSIATLFTFDGWAKTAIALVIMFVILFLGYYFSSSERTKRFLFVSSLLSVFLGLVSLTMAYQTYTDFINDKPAIIFAESAEVKSAPSVGGPSVFILYEGTKVQIIDQDNEWYRIKLADGKDGWLPNNDLKEL